MTQKSPNLGIVRPALPSEGADRPEKRRLPRLALASEQFRLSSNGKVYPVADISTGGLALTLIEAQDLAQFPVGSLLEGHLNLQREKHEVLARVRNVGRDRVGCEFENVSEGLREALARYLDPIELGKLLRPMPGLDSGMLWYQGPSNTHLMLWRGTDGQYRRLAVQVLGNSIHWDSVDGVVTGKSHSAFEPDEVRGVLRFETLVFERDEKPDPSKLQVAKNLLVRSNLPKDLVGWCSRQLRFD